MRNVTCTGSLAGAQLDFLCRLPSLEGLHLQQARSLYHAQRLTGVSGVTLTAATHLDLSPLQDLHSLDRLFCHGSASEHLHNLSALSGLVETLSLGRGLLPADVTQLTRLQVLHLIEAPSGVATSLTCLTQLQWLDTPATQAAVEACTSLLSLKTLRLRGYLPRLDAVAALTQLQRLSVFASPSYTADGVLAPLSSLQLSSLDASNFLGETTLSIPSLKDLVWAFTSSKPAAAGQVVDLSGCSQLTRLHIGVQADMQLAARHLPKSLQSLTYSYRGTGRLWCEADVLATGVQLLRADRPVFRRERR